jgi:dTDP-4-amino-4,6-dideoxygalactose transaminase
MLGGKPIFEQAVQFTRPVLPPITQITGGVEDILQSGMLTKGQHLRAFEEAVAEHLGVTHAVAVSSCTSGLMLTHQGLGLRGDVIVPSFTFMATVSALVWNGLRPVFVDVDANTTNLAPDAVTRAITPTTCAIVAVHNYGNPADVDTLDDIAHQHQLKLIFDAAHGFGALYQGVPVGAQGDVQVFSLSPTKLVVAGEGGIVATNDDDLAEMVRIGREYGNPGDYTSHFAGLNARMPEINALLGLHSLSMLEAAAKRRNAIAARYRQNLHHLPGITFQKVRDGDRNAYKDFSIFVEADEFGLTRDELAKALAAENIDTRQYHHPPVHQHKAYRHYIPPEPLPNTMWLSERALSLPIWSRMDDEIVDGICQAIERIQHHAQSVHTTYSGEDRTLTGVMQ